MPVAEQIATFDNDGTLWSEQPMYFQVVFRLRPHQGDGRRTIQTGRALSPTRPFSEGDMKALAASGEKGAARVDGRDAHRHDGRRVRPIVQDWGRRRRAIRRRAGCSPRWSSSRCSRCLNYLRANGFKTYIVSGGGVEFMRPWTGACLRRAAGAGRGQPRQTQVAEVRDGAPVLVKLPAVDLIDDKEGKPVGISQVIGRRPSPAFRQLRRRFSDARVHHGWSGPAIGAHRAPHRRRARVGVQTALHTSDCSNAA